MVLLFYSRYKTAFPLSLGLIKQELLLGSIEKQDMYRFVNLIMVKSKKSAVSVLEMYEPETKHNIFIVACRTFLCYSSLFESV